MSANFGKYFEVNNGDSINISCTLYGQISNNSHSITWKFGSQPAQFSHTTVFKESEISSLDELQHNTMDLYNRTESSLHITKATFQMDDGKYYCIARNEHERLSDFITLAIRGTSTFCVNMGMVKSIILSTTLTIAGHYIGVISVIIFLAWSFAYDIAMY